MHYTILNFNSSMIFHLYNTKKEPLLITNTRSSSLIFCFVKTYSPYKSTMISIFYLFSQFLKFFNCFLVRIKFYLYRYRYILLFLLPLALLLSADFFDFCSVIFNMLDFPGESKKNKRFFLFFCKKKSPSSPHLKVWGFRA